METDLRKEKQIHIITHPFAGNFGGMIQAVALQKVIADNVPDAVCCIESYRAYSAYALRYRIKNILGELLLSFKGKAASLAARRWLKYKNVRQIYSAISGPRTRVVEHEKVKPSEADIRYVVGSDQVWRKLYVTRYKPFPFFFLDFTTEDVRRRSITYAASFGSDRWEGTPEETELCGGLLRQFKAVAVREDSGVALCRDVLGVEGAVQMPDPTLLLTVPEYEQIIATAPVHLNESPYIATYILDPEPAKSAAMKSISEQTGRALQSLWHSPDAPTRRDRQPLTIPQWLSYIHHADYLLTDSFHGCVFAIIFNKPFVCFGNAVRGNTRFETLMRVFHLESRIVGDFGQAAEVLARPIDWGAVNAIREHERQRGIGFLREHLTEESL